MPNACIYGAKFGTDQHSKGKKVLLIKCGKLCDPGEKFCPRHTLMQEVADKKKAASAAPVLAGRRYGDD